MGIRIDESTKLDAIVVNNVALILVDEEKLKKQKNASYTKGTDEHLQFLKIKHVGCITSLTAGSGTYGTYCKVQLNVNRTGIGNLIGYTVDEYFEELNLAKEILWDTFGVKVDFSTAKIQEIEVNRTFKTEQPFAAYRRILNQIIRNMPRVARVGTFEEDSIGMTGISGLTSRTAQSKSFGKFTFYDKKRQISYKIQLNYDLMRFEIKLVGNRNIHRNFKCEFIKLTQDLIEQWFAAKIAKLIINPLKAWQKEQSNHLEKIVQEEYSKGGLWQIGVLERLQDLECIENKAVMIDVDDLFPVIDSMKELKRKGQIKKRMKARCEKYHTIFCGNDKKKLNEILHKLTVQGCTSDVSSCAGAKVSQTLVNIGIDDIF